MINQNDKSPEISQIQTEVWQEELDKIDRLIHDFHVENQEKVVADRKQHNHVENQDKVVANRRKQVLQSGSDVRKAYKFQEVNTNFLSGWQDVLNPDDRQPYKQPVKISLNARFQQAQQQIQAANSVNTKESIHVAHAQKKRAKEDGQSDTYVQQYLQHTLGNNDK